MKHAVAPLISMSLLLGAGCAEPEPRPTPPNVSALVAAYNQPSGVVTAQSAERLLEEAATDLALVSDAEAFIGFINLMFSDLSGIGGGEDGLAVQRRGLTVGGVDVDAGGWIVYQRLCPTANGMGARGTLRATALIEIDAFEPVIWGAFADCRIDGNGLDGDLALHIDWVDGAPTAVIARVIGVTNLGGVVREGEFSLRWAADTISTRYTLDGMGEFLVGVDTATEKAVIEGANGRFVCDAAGCDGPDGGFEW